MSYKQKKIGILGGGQLGRMLIQASIDLNLEMHVMDPDLDAPCKPLAYSFTQGELTDYKSVFEFGKDKEILTIEIENVNTEALSDLEKKGVKVFPQPAIVKIIQDKRLQKTFFKEKGIPTSDFVLIEDETEISSHLSFLPAFQKSGKAGYDGRGVQKISDKNDLSKALKGPSLLEKLVDYEKEISVIVSRNEKGEIKTFPVVEMVFHPEHNLVEYLFAPASISAELEKKAKQLAVKVIESFGMVGLLAVEMFLTKDGQILVNEVAPRPHNSGHHTIKANHTSQYEQHLRAILGLPLGSTETGSFSALVNLLGEAGFSGEAVYEGVEEAFQMEGVYIHLYGKKFTKPFRKMGHVTILGKSETEIKSKAEEVKNLIKVKA